MIYVRSNNSIRLFPRASLALFLLYHFYLFSSPAGFHLLALLVLFLFLTSLMVSTETYCTCMCRVSLCFVVCVCVWESVCFLCADMMHLCTYTCTCMCINFFVFFKINFHFYKFLINRSKTRIESGCIDMRLNHIIYFPSAHFNTHKI